MDEDFDILSLAIESVEKDLEENTENELNVSNSIEVDKKSNKDEYQHEINKDVSDLKGYKSPKIRSYVGVDLCFDEDESKVPEKISSNKKEKKILPEKSVVHTGDTDSSDDEDNKYFEEAKYDAFGKFIKKQLNNTDDRSTGHRQSLQQPSWKKNTISAASVSSEKVLVKENKSDVSADPIFGIRIVQPLVSSQMIKEKMIGRTPISFAKIKSHVSHGDLNNDWVIAAVIVKKLPPRVSQNGNNYSSWILSDLKNDLKTVFLFLFGRAHSELWKTPAGSVLAILNPSVLSDKKSTEFEAKLSIKSPDQLMIWGRSKDLGQCKVLKKNGEICGAFVNSYICEVCVYHVKQEYNKCNNKSRSEFSSSGNVNLRNKVLGKNEVFYAGKSFTAVAPSGKKTNRKDVSRLKGLGTTIVEPPVIVSVPNLQRSNEILKLLPFVNNPLSKTKSTDKSRLDLLMSTSTKKETSNAASVDNSNKSIEKPVSLTAKNQCSVDTLLKSEIPGIKLPKLSNPESELLFDSKIKPCNKKLGNMPATGKSATSTQKKSKINLQKRFNSLLSLQSEVKEDKISLKNRGSISGSVNCVAFTSNEKKNTPKEQDFSFEITCAASINKIEKQFSNLNRLSPASAENATVNEENDKNCHQSLKNYPIAGNTKDKSKIQNYLTNNDKKINSNESEASNTKMSKAKMKALLYVKAKGPISKHHSTKTKSEEVKSGIKRSYPSEEEEENRKSVLSERFIQLMNQKSLHEDLVEFREYEQEMEYFEKMEKRDRLEEKMLNTYKVECKAVKCLKCNYLWFSASDACKAEGHPIKVVDAIKRFFKCGKCENRTVSLTVIPLLPCKKCSNTNWVRTAMIKEKMAKIDTLSIRGGEQKFTNSVVTNASLNLLIPDD